MDDTPVDSGGSAREQRVRALRNIDGLSSGVDTDGEHRQRVGSSHPPTRRRMRVPHALMVIGLAALTLTIVVVGIAAFHRAVPSGVRVPTKQIAVAPLNDGLACARDAAWSPSADRIALVGYAPTGGALGCPSAYGVSSSGRSGIVTIYQSRDGRLVSQYHPDTTIKPLLTIPASVLAVIASSAGNSQDAPTPYTIDYTHVLWAPDGSHLYVTWLALLPTGLPNPDILPPVWPSVYATGVVAIDTHSGSMRAMSTSLSDSPYHAVGWDLAAGKVNSALQQPTNPTRFATLAPAQFYQWTAAGLLTPMQPLPTVQTAAVPAQPISSTIGSPQGGATFSVWQPGLLELHVASDTNGKTLAGMPSFATDMAAVSPDGRYLVEGVALQAISVTNSSGMQQAQSYATQGLGALPIVPTRDHAFAQVEALTLDQMLTPYVLSRSLNPLTTYGAYLAWSPNGRYLAAIYRQPTPAALIYDCQAGTVVAKLAELTGATTTDDNAPKLLRWSADGTRLLALDPSVGAMTLWGPGQLPT